MVLNPLQQALAQGCHLTRDTLGALLEEVRPCPGSKLIFTPTLNPNVTLALAPILSQSPNLQTPNPALFTG